MMTRAPSKILGRSLSPALEASCRPDTDFQNLMLLITSRLSFGVITLLHCLASLLTALTWRWSLSSWRRW